MDQSASNVFDLGVRREIKRAELEAAAKANTTADLYDPSVEEMRTFMKVLDWVRCQSSGLSGAIEFDPDNLSITLDHPVDGDPDNVTELAMTSGAMTTVANMIHSYNALLERPASVTEESKDDVELTRAVLVKELVKKIGTDHLEDYYENL